jgi:hypothetical protein
VSPVKYGLGSYIPEHGSLHSDRRENQKSDIDLFLFSVSSERGVWPSGNVIDVAIGGMRV